MAREKKKSRRRSNPTRTARAMVSDRVCINCGLPGIGAGDLLCASCRANALQRHQPNSHGVPSGVVIPLPPDVANTIHELSQLTIGDLLMGVARYLSSRR